MATTFTEADFDAMSWQESHVHGLRFQVDPQMDDGVIVDLVLDIDYVVEWLHEPGENSIRFRVAPATLIFHSISCLRINLDWGQAGFFSAGNLPIIDCVERIVGYEKDHEGRAYSRWAIRTQGCPGGEGSISFGAIGFTQALRREPILCFGPPLSPSQR